MRRTLPLLLPLLILSGCTRFEGPREVYQKTRAGDRADLPGYTIPEQKARGRERYTIIEDDRAIGPPGYVSRPSPIGW
jgi:hypothetical protein